MKNKQEKIYRASFVVEATFLYPFFCIIIIAFLYCIFFEYDIVRLQANKMQIQMEEKTKEELLDLADVGCILLDVENCNIVQNITKTTYQVFFHMHQNKWLSETILMQGEWEVRPISEEIRLASVGMALVNGT